MLERPAFEDEKQKTGLGASTGAYIGLCVQAAKHPRTCFRLRLGHLGLRLLHQAKYESQFSLTIYN